MIKNKVAVITGAGSGIGKSTVKRFADEGAKIVITDLNEEALKSLEQHFPNTNMISVTADVKKADEMKTVMETAAHHFGNIDIVFANAGMNGVITSIEHFEPEDWDNTLATNLKSTFLTVKYAIPHMKTHGGSIIITSSVNGSRLFSSTGMSAYSSSKAGQIAFGKMAASELSAYNIRVNIICPGAIETNINQRTYTHEDELKEVQQDRKDEKPPPVGKPEQVADTVLFLASDASSHISGTELFIDRGQTLL